MDTPSVENSERICRCAYENKYIPEQSRIMKRVNMIIEDGYCPFLAGDSISLPNRGIQQVWRPSTGGSGMFGVRNMTSSYTDLRSSATQKSDVLVDGGAGIGIPSNFEMLWPINGSLVQYSGDFISFPIHMYHQPSLDSASEGDADDKPEALTVEAVFTVHLYNETLVTDHGPDGLEQVAQVTSLLPVSPVKAGHFQLEFRFYLPEMARRAERYYRLTVTLSSVSGSGQGQTRTGPLLFVQSVTLQVICLDLVPSGAVVYKRNPLVGRKPTRLDSQLNLPWLLNIWNLRDKGAVLCCDTWRGVAVVRGLIERWRGQVLLIVLSSYPDRRRDAEVDGVAKLEESLQRACRLREDRSGPVCLITVTASSDRFISALSPRSLSFVYSDLYSGYSTYTETLELFHSRLSSGALMIGSRYSLLYLSLIHI